MKILYELVITKETGFTASDFPDRFEILREGKTPLVFKPVAISMQEMYSRLNEAEAILEKARKGYTDVLVEAEIKVDIAFYFERYAQ